MAKKKIENNIPQKNDLPKEIFEKDKAISMSYWLYILIFVFAIVLYGNSIKNDFTADDNMFIISHKAVQNGNFIAMFTKGSLIDYDNQKGEQPYRPIMLTALGIEKIFFGNKPIGFHFINVFLYALTSLLVFSLMRKLFKSKPPLLPFFITILFIAHPIHTEVVASIKGIDEILTLLFSLISLNFTLKNAETYSLSNNCIAIFAYLLALFSKENAITFVAVVPLTLYFFSNKKTLKEIAILSIPFFLLALLYLFIRSRVIVQVTGLSDSLDIALNLTKSTSEVIGTKLTILFYYLKMLVLPYPLSWDYSVNYISVTPLLVFTPIFTLLIYSILLIFALKNSKQKNTFAYCILFFFFTISVTSNLFFRNGASFGERFLYMPSLAFCIATAIFLHDFLKKEQLIYATTGVMVAIFSFITINRNFDWKNNLSLFSADAKVAANSSHAQLAYGYTLKAEARSSEINIAQKNKLLEEAKIVFKKAIAIRADNANSWYGLGVIHTLLGDEKAALPFLLKAIELDPKQYLPYSFVGKIYLNDKDYAKAKYYFEKDIALRPDSVNAIGNLGVLYLNQNKKDSANYYFQKALAIEPTNEWILDNLKVIEQKPSQEINEILALHQKGENEKAKQKANELLIISTNKGNIFALLGLIAKDEGNDNEAISYYLKAIANEPTNAQYHFNVGNRYLHLTKIDEAIKHYEEAVHINPEDYKIYHNLVLAYQKKGDFGKVAFYQKTLQELSSKK